jgi:hypothetical protein
MKAINIIVTIAVVSLQIAIITVVCHFIAKFW